MAVPQSVKPKNVTWSVKPDPAQQTGPSKELILPSFHRSDQGKPETQPQQKLRSNVTLNGQTIDNGAEIVVASTLDQLKANKLNISDILSSKQRGVVVEKPKEATIQCKLNDEVLWSKTRYFGLTGISLQTQGNENFQHAVDRICTPTRSFYADFYIPQYFYRLPEGKLLGKSKIAKAGVSSENQSE